MRNHARPRRSEKLGVDSPYLSLAEKKTHQCCCSALNKPSNGRGCHQVQESPSSWMAQGQQDTSLVWDLMASSFWVFSLIFSRVTSSVTSRKGHTGNQQVSSISLATSHLPCLSFKPRESTVSGYWGHQLRQRTGSFQLPLLQGNPNPRKKAGFSKGLAVVPFSILPMDSTKYYGLIPAPNFLNMVM